MLVEGRTRDLAMFNVAIDSKLPCRPNFFLPVRALSRLFRRLVLERLDAAHRAGQLQFFGKHAALANARAFAAYLAPLHNSKWVAFCRRDVGVATGRIALYVLGEAVAVE